jgi:hypothetical protein
MKNGQALISVGKGPSPPIEVLISSARIFHPLEKQKQETELLVANITRLPGPVNSASQIMDARKSNFGGCGLQSARRRFSLP